MNNRQEVCRKKKLIPRDISWLSFNARVLQEANDLSVPLKERIRFLGIFSNNLEEFFRVRVAAIKKSGTRTKVQTKKSSSILIPKKSSGKFIRK